MIPLPRASVLAGVMIVGVALGMMIALLVTVDLTVAVRPDLAIGLVLGIPGAVGLLMVLTSSTRWVTALGAMILAIGPGCFGAMTAIQVATGG